MSRIIMNSFSKLVCMISILLAYSHLDAQKVLIDKGVNAGELRFFPDYQSPDSYYYLLNKASISQKSDGTPELSFMQYVYDQGNNATQPEDAGGIFHAMVELKVSDQELRDAESELKRLVPNAVVKGPIMWKSGKVTLVTALEAPNGEIITQVVGLGDAPILDRNKAAVSILLSQKGARILEASLNSPTPALAFNFVMELEGYSSPKQVKIEADFRQIYTHKTMELAAVTPVLATEINRAYEELESQGAITVTQYGDDEELELARQTAYDKFDEIDVRRSHPQGGRCRLKRKYKYAGSSIRDVGRCQAGSAVKKENLLLRSL